MVRLSLNPPICLSFTYVNHQIKYFKDIIPVDISKNEL